ncbi:hypothetical protein [Bizionia echini]|uniref:hypothetical protein n=1 Tax=Bizionia echini TaxID=649333 RepID=UPI0030DBF17F
MKTLLIKSGLFVIIVFVILTKFVDGFFVFKPQPFEESINQFNSVEKDSIDVLIFGSSHAFNTFNPVIIDSVFKTLTFNMGSGGQKITVTNYLQKELLNKTTPKVIILDVFPSSTLVPDQDYSKGLQLKVFDELPFSFAKSSKIKEVYSFKEWPSVYSRTIRNHNEWYKLGNNKNKELGVEIFRGFTTSDRSLRKKDLQKFSEFNTLSFDLEDANKSNLTKYQKDNLITFINYAKTKNIKILIVSAPYLQARYSKRFSRFETAIKKLTDSLNVDYLSFNNKFYDTGLTLDDFRDPGHLNSTGSTKATSELIRFLTDNNYLNPADKNYYKYILTKVKPINQEDVEEKAYTHNVKIVNQVLNSGNIISAGFKFLPEFSSENVLIANNDGKKYVLLEMYENFDSDELSKYEFSLQFLFHKKDYDKRPTRLIELSRDRISTSASAEVIKDHGKIYLLLKLNNIDLDEYQKTRIFLKNPGKYKKRYGKVLEIENIKF